MDTTQPPEVSVPQTPHKDQTPEPTKAAATAMVKRIETALHQALDAGCHFRLDSPPNGHKGKTMLVIEIFKPEQASDPLSLDLTSLRDKNGLAPWQGK